MRKHTGTIGEPGSAQTLPRRPGGATSGNDNNVTGNNGNSSNDMPASLGQKLHVASLRTTMRTSEKIRMIMGAAAMIGSKNPKHQ